MDLKFSLISFDGLAEIGNNLLNKLSEAIGWVATHDTPTRLATSTYIQDIQNSDYDPLLKAALISKAKKSIKEYCNQQNVVKIAIQAIKSTAKPKDVDDDWLAQFMDKARLVSDAEFQIMWGHILAEECNEPGSVPKALLHIMEQMDKEMATTFLAVASVSVTFAADDNQVDCSPVIWGTNVEEYYRNLGISYDGLVNLQAVGLIETHFGMFEGNFGITCNKCPVIITYFDEEYEIKDNEASFEVGNVIYTKAGAALCRAVKPNKINRFLEDHCIPRWEKETAEKRKKQNDT